MKILISNDDGVQADGIHFLNEELKKIFQTTVIAPHKERSSCGHGISLGEPLRVEELRDSIYECSGLPADCVLIGVGQVMKDNLPDLVVSGINHGANLGQDRFYSGTLAAAREGSFRGITSIAVSLVTQSIKDVEHFEVAALCIRKLIEAGVKECIPPMTVLNINVPNVPLDKINGLKLTTAGFQQYSEDVVERVDTRGKKYYWVGGTYQGPKAIAGSDCDAVLNNFISLNLQNLQDASEINLEPLEHLVQEFNLK